MTKNEALAQVRVASISLSVTQPGRKYYSVDNFRSANAALARAELMAADAGASALEITQAAEWNGVIL